ncbi:MAG: hypothetical protein P1U80_02030 [Pseudomonadales bacterium]|nr:hypothetical protein [Pseudomonadales bacterium]
MANGNYEAAKSEFKALLPTNGRNAILYNMEIGAISHIQGSYSESNKLLEAAERITEEDASTIDNTTKAILGGDTTPYEATDFEKVLINYYKMMNYLCMSQLSTRPAEHDELLGNARVEARRIDIKLHELALLRGDYKAAEEQKNSILGQITTFVETVTGRDIDKRDLIYRDDPWSHYLAGFTYEQQGELDNARLEYEKAATLYEGGAAKQYQLQGNIAEQAWFDTIRVMKKSGGYNDRWTKLAQTKLSTALRSQLEISSDMGQLLVIDHVGSAPQKKRLELLLTTNSYLRALSLVPIYTGTRQDQLDQQAWFSMIYENIPGLAIGYSAGRTTGHLYSAAQKIVFLGPAWAIAEQQGLPQALQFGARVSVPYYSPLRSGPGPSMLSVGQQSIRLSDSSHVAMLALQEQLQRASQDIYEGLVREIVKTITTDKLTGFSGLGSLASFMTANTDTRSWLTLPHQIRMTRVLLAPGDHRATLTSQPNAGVQPQTKTKKFNLKKGQHLLWINHAISPVAPISSNQDKLDYSF